MDHGDSESAYGVRVGQYVGAVYGFLLHLPGVQVAFPQPMCNLECPNRFKLDMYSDVFLIFRIKNAVFNVFKFKIKNVKNVVFNYGWKSNVGLSDNQIFVWKKMHNLTKKLKNTTKYCSKLRIFLKNQFGFQ